MKYHIFLDKSSKVTKDGYKYRCYMESTGKLKEVMSDGFSFPLVE